MAPLSFSFALFTILAEIFWLLSSAAAADVKVRIAIPSESMAQIAFYAGLE